MTDKQRIKKAIKYLNEVLEEGEVWVDALDTIEITVSQLEDVLDMVED